MFHSMTHYNSAVYPCVAWQCLFPLSDNFILLQKTTVQYWYQSRAQTTTDKILHSDPHSNTQVQYSDLTTCENIPLMSIGDQNSQAEHYHVDLWGEFSPLCFGIV